MRLIMGLLMSLFLGLDMYLYESKYLGHWPHQKDDPDGEYQAAETVHEAAGIVNPLAEDGGSITVQATVMKWRKANQIHNWFVQNVQGGVDECQESEVTIEELKELRETIANVLDARGTDLEDEVVKSLLPPQSGFFFGGTEVDQWYWRDLEETFEGLTTLIHRTELHKAKLVAKTGNEYAGSTYFIYQASW